MCREVPEEPSHFPIYWAWWRISSDFPVKRARAAELLARARSRSDPELLLQAHHCNWAQQFEAGDFVRCCEHIDAGLAIYQTGDFTHHARLYGNHDAKVCAHGELAQVLWMQARPISALAQEREALHWAERMDHLGSRVHAMDMQLLHQTFRRDHAAVRRLADELVTFTSSPRSRGSPRQGVHLPRLGGGGTGRCGRRPAHIAGGLRAASSRSGRRRTFRSTAACWPKPWHWPVSRTRRSNCWRKQRREFEQLSLAVWMPELLRVQAAITLQADPGSTAAAASLLDGGGRSRERRSRHTCSGFGSR